MTAAATRKPVEHYLALEYPLRIEADQDGGYVAYFPDLAGCMTQGDSLAEVAEMAEDARRLWIETEYDLGRDIPAPTISSAYSGKFNLRLPKSLHSQLAEAAEREGVSLNQFVVYLLSRALGSTPSG